MYTSLHYPLFLSDYNETYILSTYFEKYSNIKFHENPYGVSRVVSCGQTDRQAIFRTRLKSETIWIWTRM